MQLCKLIVIGFDSVRIFQCRSENPASFVIKPVGLVKELAESALYLRLEWYAKDALNFALCSFSSYENGTLVLSPVSEIQTDSTEQFHIIESYDTVEFKVLTEQQIPEFKQKTDNINTRYRNSLTTQIKNSLSDESLTNQLLFRLLLQIDSKLDELLAHKLDGSIEGLKECRLLALSGGGLFLSLENASVGDCFFICSSPKFTSNIIFAALCKVKEVIPAFDNVIVISEFIHLDETSRDSIVHFVFEKEREKLKRIRANV